MIKSRFPLLPTRARFLAAVAVIFTLVLVGCPPTNPSITISNRTGAGPDGTGLSFLISGRGFTPNEQVNITLFNIPNRPAATNYANAGGLPDLVANGTGGFADFHVSAPCSTDDPDNVADIWVQATDVKTRSFARYKFPVVNFSCKRW